MSKITIVTGANRGIGKQVSIEMAKLGYRVIMTGRSLESLQSAVNEIESNGGLAEGYQLDVSDLVSVSHFVNSFSKKFDRLDALINNAGIYLESDQNGKEVQSVRPEIILKVFTTNTLGPYAMIHGLIPLLLKAENPCVVNVSSGMGGLSEMASGMPAYRISKTALNGVTKVSSEDLMGKIKVNSICPGWVRTNMGGEAATRSVQEGASGIVWAATLPSDGPTGGFFRDGQKIDW